MMINTRQVALACLFYELQSIHVKRAFKRLNLFLEKLVHFSSSFVPWVRMWHCSDFLLFYIFALTGIMIRPPYDKVQATLRERVSCSKFISENLLTDFISKVVRNCVFICLIIQRTENLGW